MTARSSLLALVFALGVLPACQSAGVNTQVMVTVDAEASVQRTTRSLVVRVYGGPRGTAQLDLDLLQEIPFPVAAGDGWPTLIALAPLDRDATRIYRVEAAAYDTPTPTEATVPVARVRAISGYVPEQIVWLRLLLQDACIGLECTDIQTTCSGGACVSAIRPASDLPRWGSDAGDGMDAHVDDAGARDAGAEGGTFDTGGLDLGTIDGGAADVGGDAASGDSGSDAGSDAASSDAGPPCTPTSCDDGHTCTDDFCGPAGCEHFAVHSRCDDGQPCTDDRCAGATGDGCTHTNNTVACDDGLFCNGLDQCASGTCSSHPSAPCMAPLTCDETMDVCLGCTGTSGCPAPTFGPWSGCTYAALCATSGTQSRATQTFTCMSGMCVASSGTEVTACGTRSTDGLTCMSSSCESPGACQYGSTCDTTGSAPRTCHDYACMSGFCADTFYSSSSPCSRTTDGLGCDDGNACTGPDTCSMSMCTGPTSCDAGPGDAGTTRCDDGFDCTVDVFFGGGCMFMPDDLFCDDGLSCSTDQCDPLAPGHLPSGCVHSYLVCMPDAGSPPDSGAAACIMNPGLCDDADPCTVDACMPAAPLAGPDGCTHLPGADC